jgi:hypothetical protein
MTTGFFETKDWKFIAKVQVSTTGKISYVLKASGDTLDEWQESMKEMNIRMKKIVEEMKK